jgi:hypothetical protein
MKLTHMLPFGIVAIAACGSPSPGPAVPQTSVVDTTLAPTAIASATPAGPPLPADVTDAIAVTKPPSSCSLSQSGWRGSEQLLRVSPGGPVFASLRKAHDAALSLGEPDLAFLQAGTGSLEVGGFVALADVHVGLRRAVPFGGFYVPSSADLTILRVSGDHVTLRASLPDNVTLSSASSVEADVACDDVGLQAVEIDEDHVVPGSKALREARLVAKHTVALSTGPADPPVAKFGVDDDLASDTVTVLEQRGGRVRIRVPAANGFLFGWVAANELRRVPANPTLQMLAAALGGGQSGMIGLLAGGGARSETPATTEHIACSGASRVVAEVSGKRYLVGQVDPGAPFALGAREETVAALASPGSLVAASGVRLLVPARDAVGCPVSTAKEPGDPSDEIFGGLVGRGNMFGEGIGDAFGAGGLGLSGVGTSSRSPPKKSPRLRVGAVTVNGRLPPEVIQRIVRQNFGRFRLCYEYGLRKAPALAGTVRVRFTIEPDGSVSHASDHGSDLADKAVVACVVHGMGNQSFPQPEGGKVTVVYRITMSPGD